MSPIAWILTGITFLTPPPAPQEAPAGCPPPPHEEITAAIQVAGPHALVLGREATFTLTSFGGGDWAEYKIDWEGTGVFAPAYTGPNEPTELTHLFPTEGIYTISIRVRLSDGAFGIATRNVRIEPLPESGSTIAGK